MISIVTQGCSVSKGSDKLAPQRQSRDVDKEPRHNYLVSFMKADVPEHTETSQHACLFGGYLRVNHRISVLSTVLSPLCASRAWGMVETGLI